MSGKLGGFLVGLAKNNAAMRDFGTDPHGSMTKAGLSDAEISAVLSKKPELISKAIGKVGGGHVGAADADTVVVVIVL